MRKYVKNDKMHEKMTKNTLKLKYDQNIQTIKATIFFNI